MGPKGLRKDERHRLILPVWVFFFFTDLIWPWGRAPWDSFGWELHSNMSHHRFHQYQHNRLTPTLTPAGQVPGQHLWNGPQSGGDTRAEWWVLAFSVRTPYEGGAVSLLNALQTGFRYRTVNLWKQRCIKPRREVKPVADKLSWLPITFRIHFKFFHLHSKL